MSSFGSQKVSCIENPELQSLERTIKFNESFIPKTNCSFGMDLKNSRKLSVPFRKHGVVDEEEGERGYRNYKVDNYRAIQMLKFVFKYRDDVIADISL